MKREAFQKERYALAALLAGRGIADPEVLSAMVRVPRHRFVAPELVAAAYLDQPLSIGAGQTISQPYIVALMAEAAELQPTDRVLEIGTGSGYGAAVLSRLAASVDTVERLAELAYPAEARLKQLGFGNVSVHLGDGASGWPLAAPYDAIVVTAASPNIPPALLQQLAAGGRLVAPVGPPDATTLVALRRRPTGTFDMQNLGPVRFVPLIAGPSLALPA
jgi:protein-L-isoaspartate(D-aspartate) O-methyltransferase